MDVVITVCHLVVEGERRGDDTVDHYILIVSDDCVQTLALDRLYCGNLFHPGRSHDTVAGLHH